MDQSLKVETFIKKEKEKNELRYWSNLIDELKKKKIQIYIKRGMGLDLIKPIVYNIKARPMYLEDM